MYNNGMLLIGWIKSKKLIPILRCYYFLRIKGTGGWCWIGNEISQR